MVIAGSLCVIISALGIYLNYTNEITKAMRRFFRDEPGTWYSTAFVREVFGGVTYICLDRLLSEGVVERMELALPRSMQAKLLEMRGGHPIICYRAAGSLDGSLGQVQLSANQIRVLRS
jgi:hypothetical protein